MYKPQSLVVFLDSIQRTIVATVVESSDTTLKVTKPAILNVAPTNEKKLQVQLYPLLFREFLRDRDSFPVWVYDVKAITLAENIELEPNLVGQYVKMFEAQNTPAPTIKLFDDKE